MTRREKLFENRHVMGHKSSKSTSNRWTFDDVAFGTGPKAVELEEVFQEAKAIPIVFFGGHLIENDQSMRQLQTDLLAIDRIVKRFVFRKRTEEKNENIADQRFCPTIVEEDETSS